jgi:hypothetical protein
MWVQGSGTITITIPSSVTFIAPMAIVGNNVPIIINMLSPTPNAQPIDAPTFTFHWNNQGTRIIVPAGSAAAYRAAPQWAEHIDQIEEL